MIVLSTLAPLSLECVFVYVCVRFSMIVLLSHM